MALRSVLVACVVGTGDVESVMRFPGEVIDDATMAPKDVERLVRLGSLSDGAEHVKWVPDPSVANYVAPDGEPVAPVSPDVLDRLAEAEKTVAEGKGYAEALEKEIAKKDADHKAEVERLKKAHAAEVEKIRKEK